MRIADLIEDFTAPAWEDYPDLPGFRVLLRLPDAPHGLACLGQAAAADGEAARLAAVTFEAMRYGVEDWEGLTAAGLRRLLVHARLKTALEAEAAVPFSPENRDTLLQLAPEFFSWVVRVLHDRRRREEDDEKNSLTTPNTSPTPSPAPARGAKRKGAGSA